MKMRDSILGTAITKACKTSEQINLCPALEDIAALVDGTISGAERDDLMGHLAACDRCRQVFIMTGELAVHENVGTRNRWLYISSAAAVAAVMVLAISLTLRQPAPELPKMAKQEGAAGSLAGHPVTTGPQPERTSVARREVKEFTPLSADKAAAMLASSGSVEQLTRAVGGGEKPSYGFAESSSPVAMTFRTGVYGLDLEVALRTGNREKSLRGVNRISQLLQALGGNGDVAAYFEDVGQQLENDVELEKFKGITGMIRDKIPADNKIYLRFGEWCEASRVAASMQYGDFFTGESVRYFQKKLDKKPVPKEAKDALLEIGKLIQGNENSMVYFSLLEKKITEIIEAF